MITRQEYADALGKALAKKPAERYQHLDDLLVDLRALRMAIEEADRRAMAQPAARCAQRRHHPAHR